MLYVLALLLGSIGWIAPAFAQITNESDKAAGWQVQAPEQLFKHAVHSRIPF
jgi:hypothetical protein